MKKIPNTVVEDNALHRASLWIEHLKRAGQVDVNAAHIGAAHDLFLPDLISRLELPLTPEQVTQGVQFYTRNWIAMLPRFTDVTIVAGETPRSVLLTGDDLQLIIFNAWGDGFWHGAATKAGKRADRDPNWESMR